MIRKNFKNKIITLLIISMILSYVFNSYSAGWVDIDDGRYYFNDRNEPAINCWRWIDSNNDTVAECYRFGPDGRLVTNATISDGKRTDDNGRWIVDGQIQKIYTTTYKPLINNVKRYIEIEESTTSITRINATGKELFVTIEDQEKKAKKKAKGSPLAVFSPSESGYLIGNKVNLNRPEGGNSDRLVIGDLAVEGEIKYYADGQPIVTGRDMRQLVSASKNFTKSVEEAKIWGGDVWEDVMCLAGNGAFVKFDMKNYNFFRVEVAHQTHGESTKNTYCYIELYINNELIEPYDNFNDHIPQIIEEWIDDGDKTIELRLVVEGDAKGRKVYLRNARARNIQ